LRFFLGKIGLIIYFARKISRKLLRAYGYAIAEYHFPRRRIIADYTVSYKVATNIEMGFDVMIGPRVTLGAAGGISLGNGVRISEGAYIETGSLNIQQPAPYVHACSPIHIGDNVWIGAHSIVLGGAKFGAGSVVAAGAIVTKDVPERAIVAGVPAKVIGMRPLLPDRTSFLFDRAPAKS
jgi:acetyltransferase-like isoleucine patch superfamily enzyme